MGEVSEMIGSAADSQPRLTGTGTRRARGRAPEHRIREHEQQRKAQL